MELLEYVLRNAILPGPSARPLLTRALVEGELPTTVVDRDEGSRDDPDDMVSSESPPLCSRELEPSGGMGGTMSAGASMPFFVVEVERVPRENKPLAFGADATRRIKRDADAPMDLGDRAPFPRDFEGVVGLAKEVCDGLVVSGLPRGALGFRERFMRCRSDLLCVRDLVVEGPVESASVDLGA